MFCLTVCIVLALAVTAAGECKYPFTRQMSTCSEIANRAVDFPTDEDSVFINGRSYSSPCGVWEQAFKCYQKLYFASPEQADCPVQEHMLTAKKFKDAACSGHSVASTTTLVVLSSLLALLYRT